MSRSRIWIVALSVGVALLLLVALVEIPEEVRIGAVRGEVLVQREAAGEFVPAAAGTRLGAGDIVRTGAAGSARLDLGGGDRITLQAQTEVVLRRLGRRALPPRHRTEVEIRIGRVAARVDEGQRRLDLVAPNGVVAAIRGTELRQAIDPEAGARLAVDSGAVAFSSGAAEVLVSGGFGSASRAGGAPLEPRRLLEPPAAIRRASDRPWEPSHYELVWDEVRGAAAYRVEIATDETFSLLAAEGGGAAPGFSLASLTDPGRYFLRVRSLDDASIEGIASPPREIPFDPDLYEGILSLSRGHPAAAVAPLERAADRAPDDPVAWSELGWARHLLGDWAGAVTAFERSLELDPAPSRVRVRYARDLYFAGRLEDARRSFQTVLEAHPDDADAHAGLAAVLRVEGRFDEAIAHARRALELDPEQEYAAVELRRARRRQRDP